VLQYRHNSQIDYLKWDACVEASSQRVVYALSWYLDVVSPGWAALIEEEAGRYVTVMPLPIAKKFGIRFIMQPFYTQQLGIFSIKNDFDAAGMLALLRQNFSYVSKYSFNTDNTPGILAGIENKNLIIRQHYTHHLNLAVSYAKIYQGYTRDRKLNLKRAQRANLIITESKDIRPLIHLFKADAASRITGGVSVAAYNLLERLYQVLDSKGLATLYYTTTAAGELEAGALFVTYANKIIYLFNAATKQARSRNGRTLLLDTIIQQYAGKPYVFDFESPVAVASIIRVYQGFGAEPAPFYTFNYNNLPAPVKVIKQVRQAFYQKILAANQT